MDSRLLDAAWNGSVETLFKLIKQDRRILHTAALTGGETPLHIACLAGHLDFVQQLVKLMPGFARELNPDGFSPLHIASAKGCVEIARDLLKMDASLCLIEGMNNRIPLHCAVIKGRVEVVTELISVNRDSIDNETDRGETALHLAVKNNQFKVFQVLVEHIKKVNQEGLLTMKDDQGNTILHLAVSKKLYQVVDLLLNEQVIPRGAMDLNSSNKNCLTPLDVLQLFQSEAGDRELEVILRRAGAITIQDLLSPTNIANATAQIQQSSTNGNPSNGQSRPHLAVQQPEDAKLQLFSFLLVIAVLVVTATYQALQSPPGGFWQEDSKDGDGQAPHTAGKSVMATKDPIGYRLYVFFNSIGFCMSINMIYDLTRRFPLKTELFISLFALSFTYNASLTAITPENPSNSYFFIFCFASCLVIWYVVKVFRRCFKKRRNALSGTDQETV